MLSIGGFGNDLPDRLQSISIKRLVSMLRAFDIFLAAQLEVLIVSTAWLRFLSCIFGKMEENAYAVMYAYTDAVSLCREVVILAPCRTCLAPVQSLLGIGTHSNLT